MSQGHGGDKTHSHQQCPGEGSLQPVSTAHSHAQYLEEAVLTGFRRKESVPQVCQLTSSVIMVGQSEVRCCGDILKSSTLKNRNTWECRVGTCGKRRLSTSLSETKTQQDFLSPEPSQPAFPPSLSHSHLVLVSAASTTVLLRQAIKVRPLKTVLLPTCMLSSYVQ